MSSSLLECRICGLSNPEPKHFWITHKIKESNYYLQYFPKQDLLTGELLTFKDRDSYLLNKFCNKLNFKKWLKIHTQKECKDLLIDSLIKRKEIKQWKYVPTQVELRSCPELAGVGTYNKYFKEGYYKLCEEIGFQSRGFININEKTILKTTRTLRNNPVLIDSREQTFLNFKDKEFLIQTLPVGDYTIEKKNYDIYIERKSLNDLTSTFGPKNFERFKNELYRAKDRNLYIILLVENDINTVLGFDHSPFYSKHTQMTATFLFHQIRVLL